MSDMVVVYELNSSPMVEVVMDMLREEGFHPALVDDVGGAYHRMDKRDTGVEPRGPMKVCIVVPPEERAAARLFLQRRKELADNRVAELTRELRRPMVLSALGTAVAFIVMASWYFPDPGELLNSLGVAVIAVLPASLILTANAVLARNAAGQICAVAITVAAVLVVCTAGTDARATDTAKTSTSGRYSIRNWRADRLIAGGTC